MIANNNHKMIAGFLLIVVAGWGLVRVAGFGSPLDRIDVSYRDLCRRQGGEMRIADNTPGAKKVKFLKQLISQVILIMKYVSLPNRHHVFTCFFFL